MRIEHKTILHTILKYIYIYNYISICIYVQMSLYNFIYSTALTLSVQELLPKNNNIAKVI